MAQTVVSYETFVPYDKQLLYMNDPTRYKLFGGSMGSGKTLTIVAEGIRLSLEYPGNCGYIGRHTYKDFKRSTLQTIDEMIPDKLISSYNKQDGIITLINGSIIYMGDLEYPDKFKSLNLGWFAIDEASETSKPIFDMLKTRLRRKLPGIKYYGLLASNPEPGWLKETFVDPQDKGTPLPEHIYYQSYTRDNPHLPPDYITSLIRDLPEHMRLKYVEGRWDIHETQIIDFNWIENRPKPDVFKFTAIAVDPAISEKETADESVIFVMGVDGDGLIYEREVIAGRWSFQALVDNCVDAYNKYQPDVYATEQTAFQKALGDVLSGMGIPVVKLMPDKDKVRRVMSISDLFEKRKVNVYDETTRMQIVEFPNGYKDDRCLIGETWITTNKGYVKIKDIKVGDKVLTRKGYKSVLAKEMTGKSEVIKKKIGDTFLIGTKNHPIITKDDVVHLDRLTCYDRVIKEGDFLLCRKEKLLFLTMLNSIGILKVKDRILKITIGLMSFLSYHLLHCIGILGFFIMEKFPKALLYIIKMETNLITILKILNVFLKKNTQRNILLKGIEERKVKNTWKKLGNSLRNGMLVKKVVNGILNIVKKYGKILKHIKRHVLNVLKNMSLLNMIVNFVVGNAGKDTIARQINIRYKQLVLFVEKIILKTNIMENLEVVQENAVDVYNLTIEDEHEFFANGILTHNCDCMTHCLRLIKNSWIEQTVKIKDRLDHLDDQNRKHWKRILEKENQETLLQTTSWD